MRKGEKMLHYIAVKSTDILKKNDIISYQDEKVYIYGFELLYSFSINILCILLWSTILGCVASVFTFLLFFVPIRIVAGGYHAKTYGSCFFGTNLITGISVLLSKQVWRWNSSEIDCIMWWMFFMAIIYVGRQAPVVPSVAPLEPEIIIRNRKLARVILGLEGVVLILMKILFNNALIYTAIAASCIVAVLINKAKKGENEDGDGVNSYC